jgi:hypothetical protein
MGSSYSTKNDWNRDEDFEIFIKAIQEVKNKERFYFVKNASEKFLKLHKVSPEKLNVFNGILAIMQKQYVR